MGAFELGWQHAADATAQRHAQKTGMDMLTRQFLSEQWQNAANNVTLPPQQIKDETTGQMIANPAYQKAAETRAKYIKSAHDVYSPDHHANLFDSIHGLITGKQEGAQPQTSPAPNGAPTAAPGSTPGHPFQPITDPNHPLNKGQQLIDSLKQHLHAAAHPIAPKPEPDWMSLAQAPGPQDVALAAEKRKNDAAMALQKQKGADAVAAANARGSNARPAHIGDVTPKDAINNIRNLGYEYADEEGNPISEAELAEAPDYMKLVEFRQGNKTFAKLVDQRSKEWNIGGKIYQAGELGKQTPETLSELGAATSTLPREHEVPGMNPGEKLELGSGVTQRPGITTPAATPTPAPAATPALNARPQPQAKPVSASSMDGPNARLNLKRSNKRQITTPTAQGNELPPAPSPFAAGTFQTQGKTTKPIIGAMQTVIGNVVGDEGQKPLWEYAPMFDKPELATALNKALTLNALTIPGTEDDPSFMQSVATGIGLTGLSQEQIHDANVEARNDLQRLGGADAMEMFARLAAFQEDLSALRSATKSSAAQGAIKTIVRASPVYNASSGQNFRDQLAATLTTGRNAMKGYPEISPKYIDWWAEAGRRARGIPVSAKSPNIADANKKVLKIKVGSKNYTYNGTGDTADIKNYTEVKQ